MSALPAIQRPPGRFVCHCCKLPLPGRATDFLASHQERASEWDPNDGNNSPGCFTRAGHKLGRQLVSSVTSFYLRNPEEEAYIFILILQMRKLRPRAAMELVQSHAATHSRARARALCASCQFRACPDSPHSFPLPFIHLVNVYLYFQTLGIQKWIGQSA